METMRKLAPVAFIMLATLALIAGGAPRGTRASSHREAPYTSTDPQIDATDVYAWVSPDRPDSVTLVANYIPLQAPYSGPNFHRFGEADSAMYEINVDNDGDAVDDITFQFRFYTEIRNPGTFLYNTGPVTSIDDPDLNIRQFYSVSVLGRGGETDPLRCGTLIANNIPVAPAYVGPKSFPEGYEKVATQAIRDIGNGIKVFAGPRDDPFFVDLGGIFDLLSGIRGVDDLSGYNVHTIAIQVPKAGLRGRFDPVIGVHTSAYRPGITVTRTGDVSKMAHCGSNRWVQVSRLDMPLVNEVVLPLALKDAFNSIPPWVDYPLAISGTPEGNLLAKSVLDPELGRLLPAILGVRTPPPPRMDIATIFLTGIGPVPGLLPNGLNQPNNPNLSNVLAPAAKMIPASLLRLNMDIPPSATPNRLGLLGGDAAGFPNGRRPVDDVTDIELQAVAGQTPFTPEFNTDDPAKRLGDGVNANDRPFMPTFPYLAEPAFYTSPTSP
jgi:hypothetical protein